MFSSPASFCFYPTVNLMFLLFETVLWNEAWSVLMFSCKTWEVDMSMFQAFLFHFEQFLPSPMSFIFIKCNLHFQKILTTFLRFPYSWRLVRSITWGKSVKYYYNIYHKITCKLNITENQTKEVTGK